MKRLRALGFVIAAFTPFAAQCGGGAAPSLNGQTEWHAAACVTSNGQLSGSSCRWYGEPSQFVQETCYNEVVRTWPHLNDTIDSVLNVQHYCGGAYVPPASSYVVYW